MREIKIKPIPDYSKDIKKVQRDDKTKDLVKETRN